MTDTDLIIKLAPFGGLVALVIMAFVRRGALLQGLGARTPEHKELATRMESFARDLGLQFSEADPLDIARSYYGFGKLFGGIAPKVFNVAYGKLGDCSVKVFDCQRTISAPSDGFSGLTQTDTQDSSDNDPSPWSLFLNPKSARSEEVVVYSSAVILDTSVVFRPIFIRPEGISESLAKRVTRSDITFESDEFNRAFYVECPDRKFAFDLLTPRVMQLLLDRRRWSLDLFGRSIIIYSDGTLGPSELKEAIRLGQDLLGLVPDYLRASS